MSCTVLDKIHSNGSELWSQNTLIAYTILVPLHAFSMFISDLENASQMQKL